MKTHLFSCWTLCLSFLFSQILTVNDGSSVSISSGSSITLDGLEIAPTTLIQLVVPMMSLVLLLLLLQAPIALCPVCTVLLLYCQALQTRTFSYLDGELNDIVEGDLVLELQADDDSWTTYTGTVDEVNNTVSYTFNDPVSFKAVTASAADTTLTIEDIYPLDSRISVYPNPTTNKIYIKEKTFYKLNSLI